MIKNLFVLEKLCSFAPALMAQVVKAGNLA